MKLKERRTQIGMTQKQLAEQMKTTQQTIARWESGKTTLNVEQIRELCLTLGCTAAQLMGRQGESAFHRYSSVGTEPQFGTLNVHLTCGEREYPIGEDARTLLLRQIDDFASVNGGGELAWLNTWSLDNKLLLINSAHLKRFKLISDEDEEMPSYENPEVYKALEEWPSGTVTGVMREKCAELVARLGGDEAARRSVDSVRVTYEDGTDEWGLLSDDIATAWYGMATGDSLEAGRNYFVMIDEEIGSWASFVNLARVAAVEIPANRFFQIISDD